MRHMCLKPHLSPPTHRSRRFDHLVLESVYTPQLVLMVQVAVSMVREAVYTPQLVYTPRIVIMVRESVFTPQEAVFMVRECGELERLHWRSDELCPVWRHGC